MGRKDHHRGRFLYRVWYWTVFLLGLSGQNWGWMAWEMRCRRTRIHVKGTGLPGLDPERDVSSCFTPSWSWLWGWRLGKGPSSSRTRPQSQSRRHHLGLQKRWNYKQTERARWCNQERKLELIDKDWRANKRSEARRVWNADYAVLRFHDLWDWRR